MTDKPSFIDLVYNKINEVIGGTANQQFFTLSIPGTLLDKDAFTSRRESKVAIHESNLANNLIDAAQVAPAHNGRKLYEQYRKALSHLLPQLNPALEKQRTRLRELLSVKAEHLGTDDNPQAMTKLDYFNLLGRQYDSVSQQWAQRQQDKLVELQKRFPDDQTKITNEYDTWFSTVAPSSLRQIENARTQLNMVLSPDEIGLIRDLLGSGDNQLDRDRRKVQNAEKQYPDGICYPVSFTPDNWSDLLKTDFHFLDLLDSPEAIAMKISSKQAIVDTLTGQLAEMSSMLPKNLQADMHALTIAKAKYHDAQKELFNTYTDNAATAAEIYLKSQGAGAGGTDTAASKEINGLNKQLNTGNPPPSADKTKVGGAAAAISPEDIKKLTKAMKGVNEAQTGYTHSGTAFADAALKVQGDQVMDMDIVPYIQQLRRESNELEQLNEQLVIAGRTWDKSQPSYPTTFSQKFQKTLLTFNSDDISTKSNLHTSFKHTEVSASFLLWSAGHSQTTQESDFSHDIMTASQQIEIGMLLAKVEINRDWFDPGVFAGTSQMAINDAKISPGIDKDFKDDGKYILPSYPVAFVIAKDITIKVKIKSGKAHRARQILDKHSSTSGGFLCFSGSHVSSSHDDNKTYSSHVEGENVVIRLGAPQIIGWYQEFVPKDNSKVLKEDGGSKILNFLATYQRANSEHNNS